MTTTTTTTNVEQVKLNIMTQAQYDSATKSATELYMVTDAEVANDATITIQKNGTTVDSFTTNQATNKTINITVPVTASDVSAVPTSRTVNGKALSSNISLTASDVSALPSTTKYGASIDLSLNTTDYKLTMTLKDQSGNTLGTAKTVDFPIESVVVNGSYDNTNKKIVLTLQNGSTIDVPVGDLISGLQSEITSSNKLSADLIQDGTTNKVVTASEKTTWNGKQDALVSGTNIKTINGNSVLGSGDITTSSVTFRDWSVA